MYGSTAEVDENVRSIMESQSESLSPEERDESHLTGSYMVEQEPHVKQSRWRCCSLVTVEPITFIYAVYLALSVPMTQQYVFARVALDYNSSISHLKNFTTCASNHSDPDYILHQNVQRDTSGWWAVLNAVQLPFAFLATLFLGSYSDKGGRKLGLILPSIGAVLKTGLIICITYMELPKQVLLAAFMVEGVFGGYGTFLMSTFSYISDVTSHRNRALRIVIVESALGIGIVAGTLLFALLPYAGFLYLYILLAAMLLVMLLYVLLVLRESRIVAESPKIFSTEHIKQMIKVYTTNDEHGRRWKLIISVGILLFGSMVEIGRGDVILLFVQNTPLCWPNILMSLNGSLAYILSTLGSIGLTKLLQNRLQDLGLMLVGSLSMLAQSLLLAFATQTWMVFTSSVIGMLGRLMLQLLRSFTSKVVTPDEQGAMYAAYAMIQVAGGLGGSVFFTTIYNVTLDWMAGFVFIVCVIFMFICTALIGVAFIVQKKTGVHYAILIEETVT